MDKALGYISASFRTLICLLLFFICQMSALFLFSRIGLDYKVYVGSFIALYSSVVILVFVAYSYISSLKSKRLIERDKIEVKNVLVLILIGFGLLGIVSVYMIVANLVAEIITPIQGELDKYSESMDRFASIGVDEVPWWDPLIDVIASSFIIPMAEEMVFRGAIFGELCKKFNWVVSAVLSSAIFGLCHGVSVHIGYALISGILLCAVYRFTNSIFASYIVHATFNFFGSSIFTLIDSKILSGYKIDSNILNLGLFGIEVFAILPAVLGLFLFYRVYKTQEGKHEGLL